MVLKQRANFYNNIATEMVPCQKPMMLKDALDFEKVLMNPKDAQVRLQPRLPRGWRAGYP